MLAHEGYPGHLYQSAYFNGREPVPVRRLLACGGYNEGWGLYSELYAYSFDNGLPEAVKPLMRCSEASSYGLYALLDICIHYDGWDLATTTSYLEIPTDLRIRNPRARYTWQSLIIRAIT